MAAVTPEAIDRHKAHSRPSVIRSTPLVRIPRPFKPTALRVIAFLNGGCSLGEAASLAGTAKSTARVIRLRAARRGLLNKSAMKRLHAGKRWGEQGART